MDSPDRRKEVAARVAEALICCAALVFVLMSTYSRPLGDPATSRLATVYSIYEWGTFQIDRPAGEPQNPFESQTIDKVMVRGRVISSKPPILPMLMAAEYVVLHTVLGWDLNNEDDVGGIVRFMTLTLIGIPFVVSLWVFGRTLALFGVNPGARAAMVTFLAFGTQLWGFSTLINNHVPGACALIVALYFALGLLYEKLDPKAWRFVAFGVSGGLVSTVDIPATIWVAIGGLCLLKKFPVKTLIWVALGTAIPVGPHVIIMIVLTGTPLPVQMNHDLYLSEASYWRHPFGIDGLNEPKGTYLFHMTFGRCGIFLLFPVLLTGLIGGLRALVKKASPWRGAILAGAVGFAAVTAYYCLRTNGYGGVTYGFRWYIAAMPVLLLMGAPLVDGLRCRWQWVIMALLFAVSLYSAYEATTAGFKTGQEWPCRFFGPNFQI
jgi:hypothetical protein